VQEEGGSEKVVRKGSNKKEVKNDGRGEKDGANQVWRMKKRGRKKKKGGDIYIEGMAHWWGKVKADANDRERCFQAEGPCTKRGGMNLRGERNGQLG